MIYSEENLELVSYHQKACIELLAEGDYNSMISARLALLNLLEEKDAEIAALKAKALKYDCVIYGNLVA